MIEFGKTLREAREAKGLDVSQLAERTHILPQIITSLEKEDFSKIVAPIYGRGFVKLYCEAVGLEAKPLIDEFMDIYNGNRPPTIRLREPESPVVEQEEPEFPTASETDAPEVSSTCAATEAAFAQVAPAVEPEEPPSSEPELPPVQEPMAKPKRDYRLPGYSMPEVPRSFWRFGLLIGAGIAILALLFLGCRYLYRATMRTPGEAAEVQPTEKSDTVT